MVPRSISPTMASKRQQQRDQRHQEDRQAGQADDDDLERPGPDRAGRARCPGRPASGRARPAAAWRPRPSGCACPRGSPCRDDQQHGLHRRGLLRLRRKWRVELVEASAAAPRGRRRGILGRARRSSVHLVALDGRSSSNRPWRRCAAPRRPAQSRRRVRRQGQRAARTGSRPAGAARSWCRRRPRGRWSRMTTRSTRPSSSASACEESRTVAPPPRQRREHLVEAPGAAPGRARWSARRAAARAGCRASPAPGRAAGACPSNRCRRAAAPPRPGRRGRAASSAAAAGSPFSRA